MTGHWFFLSYARRDAVGARYVEMFHKRLAREIARQAALPTEVKDHEIGYLDEKELKPGEPWPDELVSAIRLCKLFVCLYSPAYFNSDWCGKELQVFSTRLAASASFSPTPDPPSLIIPILWDRADRLPKTLPPALKDLQYAHGSSDELYKSEGLYQLMSLKKHRDRCTAFFDQMATTIVQRVRGYPLPPADVLPPLHEVKSAFEVPLDDDRPSGPVDQSGSTGPRTAKFVYVAAKDMEIRERRERIEAYGSEGGRDWRPYLSKAVGVLGQRLSAQEELFYEVLHVDDRLLDRLREAERDKNIVVIVVDPWTIQLRSYEKCMLQYDEHTFVNAEILIPWDERDEETARALEDLRWGVKQAFRRHFIVNTAYIRDSINSPSELERELTGAISRARARIIQLSEFVRPVDTRRALPRYSRPIESAR